MTDLNYWPRLVQLAYLLFGKNGNKISGVDHIIKPNGFTIPADASKIHGISTEKANKEGKELLTVLKDFQSLINQAEHLVAHNMSFDEKIVGAEFLRNKIQDSISTKRKIWTNARFTMKVANINKNINLYTQAIGSHPSAAQQEKMYVFIVR